MTKASRTLAKLLLDAQAADLIHRIELRDEIAAHGTAALKVIEPWIADPRLGAFAVRVIQRVAGQGVKAGKPSDSDMRIWSEAHGMIRDA